MLQFSILAIEFNHSILTFLDVQLQPVFLDSGLGHANSGRQSSAVVSTDAIGGNERCDQPVGQAAFGFFLRFGHRDNHLATRQRVSLAGVKPAAHRAPINSGRIGVSRVAIRGASPHIDDR